MNLERVKGVKTVDGKTIQARLSAVPSQTWIRCFHQAGETTSMAVPKGVRFREDVMEFTPAMTDRGHIQHWIEYIEKWIRYANAESTRIADEARRKQEQLSMSEEERRRGIDRMNDDLNLSVADLSGLGGSG